MLSIITPFFNKEKYIDRLIESIDFEYIENLIIIDDDSESEFPDKIKLLDKVIYKKLDTNMGASYCRNLGASIVNSEYIAFIDADDYYLNHSVRKIYELCLKKHDVISWNVSYSPNNGIDEGATIEGESKNKYFYHVEKSKGKYSMTASSICLKRSVFESLGGFNEDIRVYEDPEFFCRLSKNYKTHYIDTPFSVYDINVEGSLSKINFMNVSIPKYVEDLYPSENEIEVELLNKEYMRYLLMSCMNKRNNNFIRFYKSPCFQGLYFKNQIASLFFYFIPSFVFVFLYQIFRRVKYNDTSTYKSLHLFKNI